MQQAATTLRGSDVRDAIRKGLADALHCEAWCRCEEECGRLPGNGARLDELCGEATAEARAEANKLVCHFGRALGLGLDPAKDLDRGLTYLAGVYDANVKLEGHTRKPDPHSFGWYLAMHAIGCGTSWSDDHPDHDLKPPSVYFDYGHPKEYGATLPLERAADVLFSDYPPRKPLFVAELYFNDKPQLTELIKRAVVGADAVLIVYSRPGMLLAVLGMDDTCIASFDGETAPPKDFARALEQAMQQPEQLARALVKRIAPGLKFTGIDVALDGEDRDADQ